jgi:2-oxoglutarate ferredoxin oxidoreductase subunit gamma
VANRTEILISGFGGQGVVRLGQILGQAAVHEGLYTTMLISHGTETRGGYVRSQVVLSPEPIDSPSVEAPDFFCAFSSVAYQRFKNLCHQGVILYDPEVIASPDATLSCRQIPIAAGEVAQQELKNPIFANTVMLGALGKRLSGRLSRESLVNAIEERLPRFHKENQQAFELGYALDAGWHE